MPFTLREMQHRSVEGWSWFAYIASAPRFWAVLAVASVFFALIAPFGMAAVPFAVRLSYWSLTSVATSLVAVACIALIVSLAPGAPRVATLLAGAALSAFPNTPVVVLMVRWLMPEASPVTFWQQFPLVLPVGLVMAAVMYLAFEHTPADDEAKEADRPNPLMDRLPVEKRGAVISLSVEDHYVRVTTVRGEELVLMRMGDAVQAMGAAGMRIHRSHWIAYDHVAGATRVGGKPHVRTSDGRMLPVSRTYAAAARERGLLR